METHKGIQSLLLTDARARDLFILRRWKNRNLEAFFHREEISLWRQIVWFALYMKRQDDTILIVRVDRLRIGCIGVRWKEGAWDIYNVILGDKRFAGKGIMSKALEEISEMALRERNAPVRLVVLIDNPAVEWYRKRGFEVIDSTEKAHIMQLRTTNEQGNARESSSARGGR